MTRAYIIILLIVLQLFSCNKQEPTNQGRTSACWIYAMCACIEHEARHVGDSVVLSRQWLLARELEEQALGGDEIAIRNVLRGIATDKPIWVGSVFFRTFPYQ